MEIIIKIMNSLLEKSFMKLKTIKELTLFLTISISFRSA